MKFEEAAKIASGLRSPDDEGLRWAIRAGLENDWEFFTPTGLALLTEEEVRHAILSGVEVSVHYEFQIPRPLKVININLSVDATEKQKQEGDLTLTMKVEVEESNGEH